MDGTRSMGVLSSVMVMSRGSNFLFRVRLGCLKRMAVDFVGLIFTLHLRVHVEIWLRRGCRVLEAEAAVVRDVQRAVSSAKKRVLVW